MEQSDCDATMRRSLSVHNGQQCSGARKRVPITFAHGLRLYNKMYFRPLCVYVFAFTWTHQAPPTRL